MVLNKETSDTESESGKADGGNGATSLVVQEQKERKTPAVVQKPRPDNRERNRKIGRNQLPRPMQQQRPDKRIEPRKIKNRLKNSIRIRPEL